MRGNDRYRVGGVSCTQAGCRLPVANLSVGGLFVVSDEPPLRGEALALELLLPWGYAVPVSGRVAWINERDSPSVSALPPGFGVKLERLSTNARVAMLKLLRETDAPGRTPARESTPA